MIQGFGTCRASRRTDREDAIPPRYPRTHGREGVASFQALDDPGFRNMPGFAKNGSRGCDPSQVSSHTWPGRARVLARRDRVARFPALDDPGFRNIPGFAKNGSRGRDPSQLSSRSTGSNPSSGQSHFSPRLSSASESLSRILICRDKSQRTPNISIVARMARFPKVYLLEP